MNKKAWVYETLKKRIINVELRPGLPINEAEFAQDLGVSKTPIREALRQLERDGLVENVPSRGSTISHVTNQEISDVFQIREIIEAGASKRAAQQHGNSILRRLRVDNEKTLGSAQSSSEYVHEWGKWEDVHLAIIQSLGNQLLLDVYNGLIDRILRIRNLYGPRMTRRRFIDVSSEHIAILDAILDGNATLAEESMLQHLQNASVFLIGVADTAKDQR